MKEISKTAYTKITWQEHKDLKVNDMTPSNIPKNWNQRYQKKENNGRRSKSVPLKIGSDLKEDQNKQGSSIQGIVSKTEEKLKPENWMRKLAIWVERPKTQKKYYSCSKLKFRKIIL